MPPSPALGYPLTHDDDEYLEFLADGGYMVETIAKLLHPEGIEIGWEKGPEHSALETMRALQVENIVLFEATILSGTKAGTRRYPKKEWQPT